VWVCMCVCVGVRGVKYAHAFMAQPWVAANHVQALPRRAPTVLGACVWVYV